MTSRKLSALYALCVGASMAIVWIIFAFTGTVFGAHPAAEGLSFHIAAEIATGAAMLAAGIMLLKNHPRSREIYFLALGLLLYALVNSPGLYLKSGGGFVIVAFAGSFVFTIIFLIIGLKIED